MTTHELPAMMGACCCRWCPLRSGGIPSLPTGVREREPEPPPRPEPPVLADDRLAVSVEEAGELLGISRPHAYEMVTQGAIPSITFGRRKLVPKAYLRRVRDFDGTGSAPTLVDQ